MQLIGMQATTLTPFAYHSLMVQNGTATLPELISDHAIAFGLAGTLGLLSSAGALPTQKNYRQHLTAMPYRCSVFRTEDPRLLSPLIRRLNLDAEAGYKEKIDNVARKGNLKTFFSTQEVPQGQTFTGLLFGWDDFDPFAHYGRDHFVIRIGLHRNGMVRLEKTEVPQVCLNVSTAALFGRGASLSVGRYLLHNLQLTPPMPPEMAGKEVATWQ